LLGQLMKRVRGAFAIFRRFARKRNFFRHGDRWSFSGQFDRLLREP
jgi:hypothetical protein